MCRSLSFISIVYQKNGGVENKKTCGIGGGKNSPVQYNVSAFNSPFAIPTSQTPFSMSSSLSMQESEKNASGVWKEKDKKKRSKTHFELSSKGQQDVVVAGLEDSIYKRLPAYRERCDGENQGKGYHSSSED